MFSHLKSGFESDLEPSEFYLSPNYPNPFREKTKIKYCVAQTTRVKLTVFDSAGNEIVKLVDEEMNPGTYEVEFQLLVGSQQLAKYRKAVPTNPTPGRGRDVNHPGFSKTESGEQKAGEDRLLGDEHYVYRLEAGDYSCEKKMIHRP